MSPRHGLKKILAPELQTDGCFATGVTHQTLLKPKENVQFQRWFFENFLGATPPEPHTGEGLQRPSPDLTPLGAPALRASAPRSGLHRRVPPLQNPGYAPVDVLDSSVSQKLSPMSPAVCLSHKHAADPELSTAFCNC